MQDVRNNLARWQIFASPGCRSSRRLSNREIIVRTPYLHCEHFCYFFYGPSPILHKVPGADDITDYRNARIYDTHARVG
jgi:hypothetical protein